MRMLDYDKFVLEKKAKFFALKAKLGYRRMARCRIRSVQERDALMKMDKKRFENKTKLGEIEVVSARIFNLQL